MKTYRSKAISYLILMVVSMFIVYSFAKSGKMIQTEIFSFLCMVECVLFIAYLIKYLRSRKNSSTKEK